MTSIYEGILVANVALNHNNEKQHQKLQDVKPESPIMGSSLTLFKIVYQHHPITAETR